MKMADDFEITPAMRRYLTTFDAWLKDRTAAREMERRAALRALRRDRYGKPLSVREREVLALRAIGVPRREIADRLGIATRTVDHHFEHIAAKLGTSDPFRLATWALRSGLGVG